MVTCVVPSSPPVLALNFYRAQGSAIPLLVDLSSSVMFAPEGNPYLGMNYRLLGVPSNCRRSEYSVHVVRGGWMDGALQKPGSVMLVFYGNDTSIFPNTARTIFFVCAPETGSVPRASPGIISFGARSRHAYIIRCIQQYAI